MKLVFVTTTILCVLALAADRAKSIIHVSHLGPMSIGITCTNGADPTGTKVENVVIMSCGR